MWRAAAMKDRKRNTGKAAGKKSGWSLWVAFCSFLFCAGFAAVAVSTFRLFGASFHPVLVSRWQTSASSAITTDIAATTSSVTLLPMRIKEAVSFPDQVLLFLKHPKTVPNSDIICLYYSPRNSSTSRSMKPGPHLSAIGSSSSHPFFVRCPLVSQSFSISLSPKQSPLTPYQWDHLVYTAIFDSKDNTTILFAKGLNLRSARVADPSRYECIFGWGFANPKHRLSYPVISAAQEIFRCKTPPIFDLIHSKNSSHRFPLVSLRTKGRGSITLPSVAHPVRLPPIKSRKKNMMCVCTMVRNQARFLQEWIIYHSGIGVQHWFIYDNNSDDDIEQVIESMMSTGRYNLSLHSWPWIKTQEAGFAHCALRARDRCEWVAFIDVDEFLYLPNNITLHEVLKNYTSIPSIGELRTACYNFGPSGRRKIPSEGVIMGYTCRMNAPERHKSIVRPQALNPSLINAVHHFHLEEGIEYVNIDKGIMVINHYKYQVWEVFKEKFYRRVATYVADWQDEENVGSKDRAPGLGTKAVEPLDWSSRFCEVTDTGLRDWVSKVFIDPQNHLLPW